MRRRRRRDVLYIRTERVLLKMSRALLVAPREPGSRPEIQSHSSKELLLLTRILRRKPNGHDRVRRIVLKYNIIRIHNYYDGRVWDFSSINTAASLSVHNNRFDSKPHRYNVDCRNYFSVRCVT